MSMSAPKAFFSLGFAIALWLPAPALHALPFADTVVSFTPGDSSFPGSICGVEDDSGGIYTGLSGEGVFDARAVTALDGAVLGLGGSSGTPGSITLHFSRGEVVDGPGADLRLYDTFSFRDGFNLEISADGTHFMNAFFSAGDLSYFECSLQQPCTDDVDIAALQLDAFSYLRITAAGNIAQGFPEAYTLDAVEALHYRSSTVPEPGTLALLGLAAVGLAFARRRKD
ncbi:PEP-CTERM protein-sorting domain-containing protein/MYXO-CTERM domain-containing protein [Nitrosospira multiformis]|nr:PEP-CTERM protein-sorting domain-containing protein/MYXO-CTERM domain-containing protein [Nitrosospira multiformis]